MSLIWFLAKCLMFLLGTGVLIAIAFVLWLGAGLVIGGKRSGGATLGQAWSELWWEVRPRFLRSSVAPHGKRAATSSDFD